MFRSAATPRVCNEFAIYLPFAPSLLAYISSSSTGTNLLCAIWIFRNLFTPTNNATTIYYELLPSEIVAQLGQNQVSVVFDRFEFAGFETGCAIGASNARLIYPKVSILTDLRSERLHLVSITPATPAK
jgi:hypothetical protein